MTALAPPAACQSTQREGEPAEHGASMLGGLLAALSAGLVANSLLGPIGSDVIEYAIPADGVIES